MPQTSIQPQLLIPEALREIPQWVVANDDKVPHDPKTNKPASVTDPATWGSYEQATSNKFFKHVGFVLTKEAGFTIIDLDDKPEKPLTDEQRARQTAILDHFASYTERSMSGRGYHIIVRGVIPSGVHRECVEMYSDSRYMICTGNVVKELPIADGYQSSLDNMHQQMKSEGSTVELDAGGFTDAWDDAELFERAMRATNGDKFNALCCGEWEAMGEYPSQSEADLALMSIIANYTRDNEQVRRIFRMSNLGKREKAQRPEYLNYALKKIRGSEPPPIDRQALERQTSEVLAQFQLQTAAPSPQLAHAAQLPPPPGLIGEIAQFIYAAANRQVPEVALTAALAFMAGISGRAYCTSGDPTGLNLYLVTIAETGTGKEGGKSGIGRLMNAIRQRVPMVDRYMGPSMFASGQAVYKQIAEQPCCLHIAGEFGHTLKRITAEKASPTDKALHQAFLDVYLRSGPNQSSGKYAHSDREKNTQVVQAPSLSILGESTPGVFFDVVKGSLIDDGLIPRFLIVEYKGKRPYSNPNAGAVVLDAGLIDRLSALVENALRLELKGEFCTVQRNPGAERLLASFDREVDDLINASNQTQRNLWNRAHLNSIRLASLIAVGCNAFQPVIDEAAAQWAIDFVRNSVNTVLSNYESGEAGSGSHTKGEAELRKRIVEFLGMSEKQRTERHEKNGGGIPIAFRTGNVIPHDHLRRELRKVQPFKDNSKALDATIEELLKADVLRKVGSEDPARKGSRALIYVLGENWK